MANMTGAVAPRPQATLIGWMTLILLLAAALRLAGLTTTPPGMTHDEADHGITAQSILDGARDIYFTVGYGREPLYDYATAAVMAGGGETIFSARLTAAFFSLLVIAGTYAWVRRAYDAPMALLTAAALAVGFWPVMAGRQALRSITLPALFVLAVYWFWRGLESVSRSSDRSPRTMALFAVAGLLLGLTAYTYIPARILWLIFPCLVIYRMIATRSWQGRLWAMIGLMLLAALLVAAPLLLHLRANPGLEVRVAELSAPLSAALTGDMTQLWGNITGSLRLFVFEGDPTWRYNIAGQPWLGPIVGILFAVGLVWAIWLAVRGAWRGESRVGPGSAAFFTLVWLVAGLSPVLITGPELSMTQAIGLLPVLYVCPALAIMAIYRLAVARWLPDDRSELARLTAIGLAVVVCLWAGQRTAAVYLDRWANEPEVRVQYETAMVTALDYIDEHHGGDVTVSTITPGQFHSPAIAALTVQNPDVRLHWFDGRQSLLLPASGGTLVLPGFAQLPDSLAPFAADADLITELPMRPDDRDRPLRLYVLPDTLPELTTNESLPAQFGQAAELVGYDLPSSSLAAGADLSLVAGWRLHEPLPHAMMFAQLVGPSGVVAQSDRLGAPGELWQSGDLLLQDLSFNVPADTPPGTYPLIVGLYTADNGQRLMAGDADHIVLADIEVVAP